MRARKTGRPDPTRPHAARAAIAAKLEPLLGRAAATTSRRVHGFPARQARTDHRHRQPALDRQRHRRGDAPRRRANSRSPTRTRSSRRASRRPRPNTAATSCMPLDVAERRADRRVLRRTGQALADGFDILVHAIAYAPREAIAGEFLDGLTRENFAIAHDISAYSLAALAKAARPHDEGPQRRDPDAELPRRRARAGGLQRDGRGQGQPGSDRALPRATTSARKAPASTRSPPARSRRWPRPASPISARCSATSRRTRRCAARVTHRGRRQRRRVPVLGPRRGRDRRDHLCRLPATTSSA